MTRPIHFTQMKPDPELLEIMRDVYDIYTTDQIACVIAFIRAEITAAAAEAAIDDEIAVLEARKNGLQISQEP